MLRDNLLLGATAGVVATEVMDVLVPVAQALGFRVLSARDDAAGVFLSRAPWAARQAGFSWGGWPTCQPGVSQG